MNKVYFVSGTSPRPGLVGVVAYLHELAEDDAEFSRFYTINNGLWKHREIHHQIVSVAFTNDPAWWLLSKRGVVVVITPDGMREEQIPGVGTGRSGYGYVDDIRVIDGELYVCGYSRQVYKRTNQGWIHADDGALQDPKIPGVGFISIDGFSRSELYSVGRHGQIFRSDGNRWWEVPSPSNSFMRGICCGEADVCAVGGNGVVLLGREESWKVIVPSDDLRINGFYGVEYFRGVYYLAAHEGVFALNGDDVVTLKDSLARNTRGYRLSANSDELWSIGLDQVMVFDGKVWSEEVCPDNQ